jgi:uncharacterized membrane protein
MITSTMPESRSDAQRRADSIRVFQVELARLEREGVLTLTDAQRAAVDAHNRELLARYAAAFDIDRDAAAKQLSLGMRIASLLGAIAFSASVLFLFYQFWGRLGTPAQLTILVGSAVLSFATTLWIHSKDASGYFTNLAAMVAFACFVLNVVMIGQIFNVTSSDKAFLAWAALALVLAYTCDLRLLLVGGLICATVFVTARITAVTGAHWQNLLLRPEDLFVPAALLLATPLLVAHDRCPSFPPVYRSIGLLGLLGPIMALSHWGEGSHLGLHPDTIEPMYQVAGFVASAAAIWLGIRRGWEESVNIGIAFFVIFLYTKFVDWWWESMPKWLFFLVVGLSAVLILLILRRFRRQGIVAFGGAGELP